MFKNILRSMTTIGLLGVLVVIGIIIIWQQNRIEAKEIENLKVQEDNAGNCIATGGSSSSEASKVSEMWAKYEFAFNDPSNLLT